MATTTSSSAAIGDNYNTSAADTKISNDLIGLKEKIDLLESMLNPPDAASPKLSVLTNDAMKSVIGYLDACGPRMIELVTACTSTQFGVLSEQVFEDVLGCNDRLQKLLLDVDTRTLTETPASTTVASAASAAPPTGTASETAAAAAAAASELLISEQFGDLLLGNNEDDPFAEAHAPGSGAITAAAGSAAVGAGSAGAKTTGETSDDFKPPAVAVAPATAAAEIFPAGSAAGSAAAAATAAGNAKVDGDDPFDNFFAERTESSNFE